MGRANRSYSYKHNHNYNKGKRHNHNGRIRNDYERNRSTQSRNNHTSHHPTQVANKDTSVLSQFLPVAVMLYLAHSTIAKNGSDNYKHSDSTECGRMDTSEDTTDPCYQPYTEMIKCINSVEKGRESGCSNFFDAFTKCTEEHKKTDNDRNEL
jgi:hypothetical protein